MSFDAEAYWANRNPKKWLVELAAGERRDALVVCAQDSTAATKGAIDNTMLPTDAVEVVGVRLASPAELGLDVIGEAPPHDLTPPRLLRFAPALSSNELDDVLMQMERDIMALVAMVDLLDRMDPGTQLAPMDISCMFDPASERLRVNFRKLLP